MDILDSMTPAQLRARAQVLTSAIARAHFCLEDGRRVGDAIRILKTACPTEIRNGMGTDDDQFPGGNLTA